jgi:hypothetical protein
VISLHTDRDFTLLKMVKPKDSLAAKTATAHGTKNDWKLKLLTHRA